MSYQDLSGPELFQCCAGSRNRDAWEEFHRRYHPVIAGVVVKCLSSYGPATIEDIEDLIHDVYLRLCKHEGKALRNFVPAGEHSDFAYLKVITRNVVTDGMSAQRRSGQTKSETVAEDLEIQDSVSIRTLERGVLLAEIERTLRRDASDRDRRIFWLHYRAGLTAVQISSFRTIGLSAKGVESVILRLTRLIRDKFTDQSTSEGKKRRGAFF